MECVSGGETAVQGGVRELVSGALRLEVTGEARGSRSVARFLPQPHCSYASHVSTCHHSPQVSLGGGERLVVLKVSPQFLEPCPRGPGRPCAGGLTRGPRDGAGRGGAGARVDGGGLHLAPSRLFVQIY